MVRSYNFQTDTADKGHSSQACELTAATNPYKRHVSGSGDDTKQKTTEPEAEVTSGMPPGVRPGDKDDPFRVYRYIKQTCLVLVWVCIGLCAEITGPTLPDLTERLCVDYEDVSRALMGKSVGLGMGAIVGGFLNEIFYSHVDLLMSLGIFMMAIACASLPLVDELWFVALTLLFIGFGEGIINTGGNPMVMYLWEENAAPYMHLLHFGFGLGALLAPQIARPFLAPDTEDENYTACVDSENGTSMVADESRIEIPYAIIGIFVFCFAWVILFFYVRGPPKGYPLRVPNTDIKVLLSASSCSPGHVGYGIGLLTLLFLYFLQATGGERAFGKFLFSFAVEAEVGFTKDEASYLQTAFWASYTLGRLLGGPAAKIVPLNWLITGDIIGVFITSVVLAIWGASEDIVLWVFTCLMGIFISLVFPNGMSWSNLQLQMNSMAVMLLLFGCSVGGFIYQAITGSLFENVGPETLMYVMVGYTVGLAIVYALMQITVVCYAGKLPTAEANDMEVDLVVIGKEENDFGTVKLAADNKAAELQDDFDTVKLSSADGDAEAGKST